MKLSCKSQSELEVTAAISSTVSGHLIGRGDVAGLHVDHVVMEHRAEGNAPHSVVVPEGTPSAAVCQLKVLSVKQAPMTHSVCQTLVAFVRHHPLCSLTAHLPLLSVRWKSFQLIRYQCTLFV